MFSRQGDSRPEEASGAGAATGAPNPNKKDDKGNYNKKTPQQIEKEYGIQIPILMIMYPIRQGGKRICHMI